jgi:hypothetical protein
MIPPVTTDPSLAPHARPGTPARLTAADKSQADWGHVAVGTRISQMVDPSFFTAFSAMLAAGLRWGDVVLPPPVGMAAHHAANVLVAEFLASGCDSLLTVDHDHTFPADALEQLRSDPRGAAYGTVCALYASRHGHRHLVLR